MARFAPWMMSALAPSTPSVSMFARSDARLPTAREIAESLRLRQVSVCEEDILTHDNSVAVVYFDSSPPPAALTAPFWHDLLQLDSGTR